MKMAWNTILILALVLTFGQRVDAVNAAITVEPEKLVLSHGTTAGSVRVTCSVSGFGNNDIVNKLSLTRILSGSSTSSSVVILLGSGSLIENDQIPALNVTESSMPTSKSLVVTLGETMCTHAANFTCTADIVNGVNGNSVTEEETKALLVEVSPGNITLTPTFSELTEGKTLELLCNEPVGTVVKGVTQINWMWEYQVGSQWVQYENDSDISPSGPPTPGVCYEVQTSRLTRVLTTDDSNRVYRCYIQRNGVAFTQFAATYSVGTVNPEGYTTTPPPDVGGDDAKKADVGAIVGGVIGGLIVVIIIIIVIVVLVRRRSNKGEDYVPEEPGSKPADAPYSAPYNPDASAVSYNQPSRFRNSREEGVISERETEGWKNTEGLHYADLDLVRNSRPPDRPTEETASHSSRTTPTEYASIRLF